MSRDANSDLDAGRAKISDKGAFDAPLTADVPEAARPSDVRNTGRLAPRQAIDRELLAAGGEPHSDAATVAVSDEAPSEEQPIEEPPATPWAAEVTVKTADQSAEPVTEPVEKLADEPSATPADESAPPADSNATPSDALAIDVPPTPGESELARPTALIEQFQQLVDDRRTGNWANLCIASIEATWSKPPRGPAARDDDELKLRRLAERDQPIGNNPKLNRQVARARYALVRWLDVREAAGQLDTAETARSSRAATQQIIACLAAIDALTMRGISGGEWRDFLLVDKLRLLTSEVADPAARRVAVRRVLDRLDSPRLSRSQRKFLAERRSSTCGRRWPPGRAKPCRANRF